MNLLAWLFFLTYSHMSYATQVEFTKVPNQENFVFNYQWHDHHNNLQHISFSLPKAKVFNRYRDFGVYQAKSAREYVYKALLKHFNKNPVSGAILSFEEEASYFHVNIKSRDKKLVDSLNQNIKVLENQFNQEYLEKKYYHQFVTHDQINAIKPHHARIANESVPDFKELKPIILEKASIKNIRKVSNYVLAFIQNIPYSTLESRLTSSGVGFSPPLKLLWENKGDCDSKMTLTASILRSLMPRIKMALVYIENHALIGINVNPTDDDVTVEHQGITYVLAEPTGPALLPLGKIAEDSEQAIYSGHYTVETFHTKAQKSASE